MTYEAAMLYLTTNLVMSLLAFFGLAAAILLACIVTHPPETEDEIKDWSIK